MWWRIGWIFNIFNPFKAQEANIRSQVGRGAVFCLPYSLCCTLTTWESQEILSQVALAHCMIAYWLDFQYFESIQSSGGQHKVPGRSRCSLSPSTSTRLYPNDLRVSLWIIGFSCVFIENLSGTHTWITHLSVYFFLSSVNSVRLNESVPLEWRPPRCFGALSKTLKSVDLPRSISKAQRKHSRFVLWLKTPLIWCLICGF